MCENILCNSDTIPSGTANNIIHLTEFVYYHKEWCNLSTNYRTHRKSTIFVSYQIECNVIVLTIFFWLRTKLYCIWFIGWRKLSVRSTGNNIFNSFSVTLRKILQHKKTLFSESLGSIKLIYFNRYIEDESELSLLFTNLTLLAVGYLYGLRIV